eukprot:m.156081 g.156081  ORF g.156081 m.156081 type:complete len:387 (+) comp15147_c8_seq1:193-1353(+)
MATLIGGAAEVEGGNEAHKHEPTLVNTLLALLDRIPLPTLPEAIHIAQQDPEFRRERWGEHVETAMNQATASHMVRTSRGRLEPFTIHEHAAWLIYTQEISAYRILNSRLRACEEPRAVLLRPFLPFIKLLLSGLSHLPAQPCELYRVIRTTDTPLPTLNVGTQWCWEGFSSCSDVREALEVPTSVFGRGSNRILLHVRALEAFDISSYCSFQGEREWILPPGTTVCVRRVQPAQEADAAMVVEVEQVPSSPGHLGAAVAAAAASAPLVPGAAGRSFAELCDTLTRAQQVPGAVFPSPSSALLQRAAPAASAGPGSRGLDEIAAALRLTDADKSILAGMGVRDESDLGFLTESDMTEAGLSAETAVWLLACCGSAAQRVQALQRRS